MDNKKTYKLKNQTGRKDTYKNKVNILKMIKSRRYLFEIISLYERSAQKAIFICTAFAGIMTMVFLIWDARGYRRLGVVVMEHDSMNQYYQIGKH